MIVMVLVAAVAPFPCAFLVQGVALAVLVLAGAVALVRALAT